MKDFNYEAQGSAYSALTIEKLNAFEIPLPSMDAQEEIVQKHRLALHEIKDLKQTLQKKNAMAAELAKSIVQNSLQGVSE